MAPATNDIATTSKEKAMQTTEARTKINGPVTAVWQVLQDTEHPTWNPFITAAAGDLVAGARPSRRIVTQGEAPLRSCATDTTASNRARSLVHEAECSRPVPRWQVSTHGGAAR